MRNLFTTPDIHHTSRPKHMDIRAIVSPRLMIINEWIYASTTGNKGGYIVIELSVPHSRKIWFLRKFDTQIAAPQLSANCAFAEWASRQTKNPTEM